MKNNTTQSDNDAFYVQAYQELESENPHIATWARALAESGGNKAQAKSIYLQLRVEALKASTAFTPAAQEIISSPTEKRNLNKKWLATGLILMTLIAGGIYFAGNKSLPSEDESTASLPASAQAQLETNPPQNNNQQAKDEAVGLSDSGAPNPQRFVVLGDTIKDNESGLIWQRCSVGQTWDGNACAGMAKKLILNEAQKYAVQGWRVPSVDELKSLRYCANGFEEYGEHGICKGDRKAKAYHNSFDMAGSMYGSSTETKALSRNYWLVSFEEAGSLIPAPMMPLYYRLVRDDGPLPQPVAVPADQNPTPKQEVIVKSAPVKQRFVAENDIVKDKQTKLIWQRCSVGQTWDGTSCKGTAIKLNFNEAQQQANNHWRLPTVRELASLRQCSSGFDDSNSKDLQDKGFKVAASCKPDAVRPTIAPEFNHTPDDIYWTQSEFQGDSARAWSVGFGIGYVSHDFKNSKNAIRLVRDGKAASVTAAQNTMPITAKTDEQAKPDPASNPSHAYQGKVLMTDPLHNAPLSKQEIENLLSEGDLWVKTKFQELGCGGANIRTAKLKYGKVYNFDWSISAQGKALGIKEIRATQVERFDFNATPSFPEVVFSEELKRADFKIKTNTIISAVQSKGVYPIMLKHDEKHLNDAHADLMVAYTLKYYEQEGDEWQGPYEKVHTCILYRIVD
ncbi:MAG: DUF1566 domain-containing protein [Methylotenera sp.]|nr:DUF1566 domain-containing protein [Methylotenera sp.]MDP2280206.1 DUF1566 domain-containing protein [Methylotenera sp.]MDP3059190.1 DUF1566 domain-containing protein [Methylotenera sp.]